MNGPPPDHASLAVLNAAIGDETARIAALRARARALEEEVAQLTAACGPEPAVTHSRDGLVIGFVATFFLVQIIAAVIAP